MCLSCALRERLGVDLMLAATVHRPGKVSLLDLTLNDLFWLVVVNLLLLESAIQNATGFTYIDEIAAILLIANAILTLHRGVRKRINPYAARMFTCMVLLVFIGLASNYVADVNTSIKPILIDLFACIKFPLALVSAYVVFRSKKKLCCIFESEAKILLTVLLVFGILNLFVQIGDFGIDPRYGLRASFRFIFGHPEMLNLAVVGILLILVNRSAHNRVWICFALTVMCLSLRSKALAFVAIVLFLLATWKNTGKLKGYQIVIGLLAAVLIGYDQFSYYFSLDGAARNELTHIGVVIADRFFPLGSGFATYASNITAEADYYSPLYYQYGLYMLDGLEPGKVTFLSDTFWPIVFGQFGWIGLALFCLMLVYLALFAYKMCSTSGQRLSCVFCFIYLLISSTAGSAFFHPTAVYLACCLGLVFAVADKDDSILMRTNIKLKGWKNQ